MEKARPNKTHFAIGKLAEMGFMRGLITQSKSSIPQAHI